MEKQKPLLLLSNDDGFNAKGLNELIGALSGLGEIIVMAPDGPRSGFSNCFTTQVPVYYSLVRQEPDVKCVKLALHQLAPRRPDIVIGGINHGDNCAINVHYSGTMGVVKEGCMKGIPSVAFSLCDHDLNADFGPMLPYVRKITEKVLEKGLPKGICLNVNFPVVPSFKGVKICRQTDGDWIREFKPCPHPYRDNYFWVTGEYKNFEPESPDTDHWALDHGYVAITPTKIDVTAYEFMDELNSWNL